MAFTKSPFARFGILCGVCIVLIYWRLIVWKFWKPALLPLLTSTPPERNTISRIPAPLINLARYYTLRREVLISLDYKFLIDGRSICSDQAPFLLNLILSVSDHIAMRKAIRDTWGSVARTNHWPGDSKSEFSFRTVFLFGKDSDSQKNKKLLAESQTFGDIVQADFEDNYSNLTLKSLMGLKWAKLYCVHAIFLMKTDEDTFVNVPKVYGVLQKSNWNNKIYGFLTSSSSVIRKGKYAVSKNSFPFGSYPQYVTGNIYLMTTETSSVLVNISQYMPYVRMEDVFITGILAKIAGLTHVAIPHSWYLPFSVIDECKFARKLALASKDYTPERCYSAWKKIQRPEGC